MKRAIFLVPAIVWASTAVAAAQGILQPSGPSSRRIDQLAVPILGTFVAISVVMWLLIAFAALRRTGSFDSHLPVEPDSSTGRPWIILGGIVFPFVTLGIMLVVSLHDLGTFSHDHNHHSGPAAILIVGHQWWWEVHYQGAESDVVSANEIHIPAGEPVDIDLASHDVIHSFWVPSLHGKVDLVPGFLNHIQIQADRSGTFQGQCAEYCGPQHALMRLVVDAEPESRFEEWLAHEAADAVPPATDQERRGQELFLNHQCALCHAVRGTTAAGRVGPDLTHFALRQGLASSAFRSDIANLSAWVTHAQALKPYAQMPNVTDFRGDELQALVAYLRRLQ
jgi:cytochrome c oxidase subunit 2